MFPLIGFGNSDSTNFVEHKSKIEIRPYFAIQNLSLKIQGESNFVTFEPGITGNVGLNISYKFIDLSIGRSVVSQKMGELDKQSRYYDIRLNSYQRRFGLI